MKTKQLRLYDFFGNEKRNNENKVLVFGRLQAKKIFPAQGGRHIANEVANIQ